VALCQLNQIVKRERETPGVSQGKKLSIKLDTQFMKKKRIAEVRKDCQ